MKKEVIEKYLAKGLSVFPVQLTQKGDKVEKKPLVEWADYQNRLATPSEVDVWCAMLDFNALGMATGRISGITVLDVDDPSITEYDSPVKTKTISGGFHLWYRYKPGVRNTVRVKNQLMDVRGDGGFIVVPPSSLTGVGSYSWEKYDFEALGELPVVIQTNDRKYEKAMEELPYAGEGERNQTAIRVAGHMVSVTKKAGWETTAWPSFQKWNETHVTPPLGDFELRRTFESACQMKSREETKETDTISILYGSQITAEYQDMKRRWGDGVTTSYPLLDEYFTFYPGQLYLVSAATHVGKTTFSLNMAARIASYGKRVLFASLEQGIFIEPRIRSMLQGDVPPTFGMLTSGGLLGSKKIAQCISTLPEKIDLFVIDHLHFMEKELKNGITGGIDKMIIDIQNLAKELDIPILVISHLRKLNEDKEPTLDDLRDSSSLSQVPSVVVQLHASKEEDGVKFQNIGQIMIRKNRITGKSGRLSYVMHESGALDIYTYKKQRITL